MNFGFKNNVTCPDNDVKLKMCQIQKELDRTITNETYFQNKLQNLNLEQFKLKKLVECVQSNRKFNQMRRVNLANQVNKIKFLRTLIHFLK